jgi:hypothetical protein
VRLTRDSGFSDPESLNARRKNSSFGKSESKTTFEMFWKREGCNLGYSASEAQAKLKALRDKPRCKPGQWSGRTGVPGPWENRAHHLMENLVSQATCHRLPRGGSFLSVSNDQEARR